MTVGVVVITANRDTHLRRLLRGLAGQRHGAADVVVVDMADASAVVDEAPLPVRRVELPVQGSALPLAAARNAGAAAIDGGQLVFLDVDCIPHPDLVADYAAALDAHPGALACGGVRYLHEGWDAPPPDAGDLDLRSDAHPGRPVPAGYELDVARPELFWSLNFGVARRTWRRLGGFDDGFRGYGAEDTDLAFRARHLGIPLLWVPGAIAYHQWHPASRLDPARTGEIVANARRFHDRWGHWPMHGWLSELAAAGAVRFEPAQGVLEEVSSCVT